MSNHRKSISAMYYAATGQTLREQDIAEVSKFANVVRQMQAYARAAVLAEREACAGIADSVNNHDNPMTARDVADAIRARK